VKTAFRELQWALGAFLLLAAIQSRAADSFGSFLKPLLTKHCIKCHGGEKVKGKVNLKQNTSTAQFLSQPELLKEMIEVLDARDMPPEDETQLADHDRARLLTTLTGWLRETVSDQQTPHTKLRRLNRFQYNHTIKDLFQLDRDVFNLSEKLMTRQSDYLRANQGTMPEHVRVVCLSLRESGGMRRVDAFPKDLRATHGFDNQGNQLTLSPLLLDSFLRLSVSILASPDFNADTVGIWNEHFEEPNVADDQRLIVWERLAGFLRRAFRGPVNRITLDRYTDYTLAKLKQGLSFTEAMKKATSAALSSPMFLYRSTTANSAQFELASRLSFFLWGSIPDPELLRLAESGELARREVLTRTIDRMLADPKIERFLDSFPAQWMQLENALAVTPDARLAKFFNLDPVHPASSQMILEPLLLFDAVFIENRPINELLSPTFGYQSEFLKNWYVANLEYPEFDAVKFENQTRDQEKRRETLENEIAAKREKLKTVARNANEDRAQLQKEIKQLSAELKKIPKNPTAKRAAIKMRRDYEAGILRQLRSSEFRRVATTDPRYGGVITSAAMLSMTSAPKRTQPIARGAWIIEVILNDPPRPPPNDVPPLDEDNTDKSLTIREKFAQHRANPDCAGCHARLDPLGFALENFDITGRWRNQYENGRDVDASGVLMKTHAFKDVVRFKQALVKEDRRFAKAFTGHLLRFALAQELAAADTLAIDAIVEKTAAENYRLKSLIREVILSDRFVGQK